MVNGLEWDSKPLQSKSLKKSIIYSSIQITCDLFVGNFQLTYICQKSTFSEILQCFLRNNIQHKLILRKLLLFPAFFRYQISSYAISVRSRSLDWNWVSLQNRSLLKEKLTGQFDEMTVRFGSRWDIYYHLVQISSILKSIEIYYKSITVNWWFIMNEREWWKASRDQKNEHQMKDQMTYKTVHPWFISGLTRSSWVYSKNCQIWIKSSNTSVVSLFKPA